MAVRVSILPLRDYSTGEPRNACFYQSIVLKLLMSKYQSQRLPVALLALFILLYIGTFTYLTFLRFDAFEARSLDLGNFDQAIWNTAHGRWFHLTNQPGIVNRLSLHVEPILIPISALYWIASTPKTLLLLQSVVVALGAIPLYILARVELAKLGEYSSWLALVFALSFLLNPSMQAANWLEFHAVTLAPTFLLAAFVSLRLEKNRLFALFAILAASCKEEIGLLVFMMGLYSVVVLRRHRFGIVTMALSLAWALFAVLGVQHFFAAGNIHWERYGYLGETPLQILHSMVTQPQLVFSQLQEAQAVTYLLRMLIPVAFLALLAPELLLLALPSLALNLLADFSPMHQVDTLIYAAPIVPFVHIAGVFGVKRLLIFLRSQLAAQNFDVGHNADRENIRWRWREPLAPLLLGLLIFGRAVANHVAYGYTPGSGNYLHLEVTEHHRIAQSILQQIPPEAKVSAQDRLNPHVSQRETVYIYPRVEDPVTGDADTIFIDVTGPSFPLHPNDLYQQIQGWRQSGFGIAAGQDGYLLLSKNAQSNEIPPEFYSAWRVGLGKPRDGYQPLRISFGNLIELVGVYVGTDRYGEIVTELTWRLLAEHERDLSFYVAYLDADGQPLYNTDFYPVPASLWYPTSLWEVEDGATVLGNSHLEGDVSTNGNEASHQQNGANARMLYRVRTLPWTLEQDRFALVVGVFYADSGPEWSNAERLIAGPGYMSIPVPLLEGDTLARIGGYEQQNGTWVSLPPADAPANPINARFGQQIRLQGATLLTPRLALSEELRVDLSWAATAPVDKDYSLFVHLMNEEGELMAQVDRQPADRAGFLPMTTWPTGQTIVDEIGLTVPDDAAIGRHRLLVGLYYWEDGERLSIEALDSTDALPVENNALEIGWIEITE